MYTTEDLHNMSYTDFIAFLQETNRCPGGKKTINRIRELITIDASMKILDVGSNTGFTSMEFARITKAHVYGIDISESCVIQAQKTLAEDTKDLQARVEFTVGSSYDIPHPNESIDVVMAGGATGFMGDKNKALSEYLRVLKPWGFLALTPLTYHTTPPQTIIDSVSSILGTTITPSYADDWISHTLGANDYCELYHQEHHELSHRSDTEIERYIQYFIEKPHIACLSKDLKEAIHTRWKSHIQTFNENHKYLGFDILIFRKRNSVEEPELFLEA